MDESHLGHDAGFCHRRAEPGGLGKVQALRLLDEEGDAPAGGDEHLVAVLGGGNGKVHRVQLLLVEHAVVVGVGGVGLVGGGLLPEGLLAAVAEGLKDHPAFLGEGGQGGQMGRSGDQAEADAAEADGLHLQFLPG